MQRVLDRVFRPLATLAIAKGMRFADAAEILRRAFLYAARKEQGTDAPVSRLSVLTGLQRRDVTRLLDAESDAAPEPQRDHSLTRLVAQWVTQLDAAPLPQHGAAPSFDALARSIRQDVHPRSLLDVLLAAGIVSLREDCIHLLTKSYVPLPGSDDQIDYLGENVGDHLSTAVANVLGQSEAVELAVHYEGLRQEDVDYLHDLWRKKLRAALEEISAEAASRPAGGHYRFRAGGYFRKEEQ
ncbi:MAG: DUF6502 family protein [Pseudomonadota bacterium]